MIASVATKVATRAGSRWMTTFPKEALLPVDEVRQRVHSVLASYNRTPEVIEDTKLFMGDYKLDSLQVKNLLSLMEAEFCVKVEPRSTIEQLVTAEAVTKYFANHPRAR